MQLRLLRKRKADRRKDSRPSRDALLGQMTHDPTSQPESLSLKFSLPLCQSGGFFTTYVSYRISHYVNLIMLFSLNYHIRHYCKLVWDGSFCFSVACRANCLFVNNCVQLTFAANNYRWYWTRFCVVYIIVRHLLCRSVTGSAVGGDEQPSAWLDCDQ
jgi:hypothetical protein